jgi:hypothetical protein
MSMAAAAAPTQGQEGCLSVTLVDEAAATVNAIADSTGESVESLLEISITLLKILVESKKIGRRVVVTTRWLWPIKELTFPRLWDSTHPSNSTWPSSGGFARKMT